MQYAEIQEILDTILKSAKTWIIIYSTGRGEMAVLPGGERWEIILVLERGLCALLRALGENKHIYRHRQSKNRRRAARKFVHQTDSTIRRRKCQSPLTQGRELKYRGTPPSENICGSPLTQGRELKSDRQHQEQATGGSPLTRGENSVYTAIQ